MKHFEEEQIDEEEGSPYLVVLQAAGLNSGFWSS